jgi:tetratricopeptide (TPR) repeat protein
MAKMKLLSPEELNKKRKHTRLAYSLAALPIAILILLLGVKVFSMYWDGHNVVSSYSKKDYSNSQKAAEQSKKINFLESWRAYYNSGTAYAADKKYDNAQQDLETALDLVPSGLNECAVRSNLAIVYEKQGDAYSQSGDETKKLLKYAAAQQTIQKAPQECTSPPPPEGNDGDQKQQGGAGDGSSEALKDTQKRLDEKQNSDSGSSSGNSSNQSGNTPSTGESSDESGREQVEKQLEQSNADRSNKESSDRGQKDGGQQNDTQKPW